MADIYRYNGILYARWYNGIYIYTGTIIYTMDTHYTGRVICVPIYLLYLYSDLLSYMNQRLLNFGERQGELSDLLNVIIINVNILLIT